MGASKRMYIEQEHERQRALDEMPETLASAHASIEALQTELSEVRQQLQKAQSPSSQAKSYLIGGTVGAVIGLILGGLIKLF